MPVIHAALPVEAVLYGLLYAIDGMIQDALNSERMSRQMNDARFF